MRVADHFSRFRAAEGNSLVFTAHSHHYWLDVTRDAVIEAWDESARLVDQKWGSFFDEVMGEVTAGIAGVLGLRSGDTLVTGQNVHELFVRVASCFTGAGPVRVLTTDSEFYSADRQMKRFAQLGWLDLVRVPTAPLETFEDRWRTAVAANDYDVVFVSQVFFDSGYAHRGFSWVDLAAGKPVMVDGYHGYFAVPVDLGPVQDQVFYFAGNYKYAGGGEGACFVHVPATFEKLPAVTGWFAQMDELEGVVDGVSFGPGASRFAGSTFDLTAWYRVRSVFRWLKDQSVSVADVHSHVQGLQRRVVDGLRPGGLLNRDQVVWFNQENLGHFITFDVGTQEEASMVMAELKGRDIHLDARGTRLRLGLAMYHQEEHIDDFLARI